MPNKNLLWHQQSFVFRGVRCDIDKKQVLELGKAHGNRIAYLLLF